MIRAPKKLREEQENYERRGARDQLGTSERFVLGGCTNYSFRRSFNVIERDGSAVTTFNFRATAAIPGQNSRLQKKVPRE